METAQRSIWQARRLCLFSSYFLAPRIPYYVREYLVDLARHFNDIIFITNDDRILDDESLAWLQQQHIGLLLVANEGYDFGMWHKALMTRDHAAYDELALVNDSCIPVAPLQALVDWCRASAHHYAGLTGSNQKAAHVQSYFLLLKKDILPCVWDYFRTHGVARESMQQVIDTYEVGLSQFLMRQGYSVGSYFSISNPAFDQDPFYCFALPMIRAGIPLIKRKFLSLTFSTPSYGHPVFRDRLLSPHFASLFAPRWGIKLLAAQYGYSAERSTLLFGESLKQASYRQRLALFVRAARRAWLYPLLGITRDPLPFDPTAQSPLTGPDGQPVQIWP